MLSLLTKLKLNNPTTVFLLPIILLIVYLLTVNLDTILTKLGFETNSTLKVKNNELNHQVDTLLRENLSLRNLVDSLVVDTQLTTDLLDQHYKNKESTNLTVNQLLIDRNKLIGPQTCNATFDIDFKTEQLGQVKDSYIEQQKVDKVSLANISTIHKAFEAFGGQK